jgi:hypothetical protein
MHLNSGNLSQSLELSLFGSSLSASLIGHTETATNPYDAFIIFQMESLQNGPKCTQDAARLSVN